MPSRRRPSRRSGQTRRTQRQATGTQAQTLSAHEAGLQAFRARQLEAFEEIGFRVSKGLPIERSCNVIRPSIEIAQRLMAIKCLMFWVCVPRDKVANDDIQACINNNKLAALFSKDERDILRTPRKKAAAQYMDQIGWKFENAWPLAWALGYEEAPDYFGQMMEGDEIKAVLIDFAPSIKDDLAAWAAQCQVQSLEAIGCVEDTFYCLHNAVRSAQLGRDTVPEGFHPIANGGVIHERRHALTWILSPLVKWDDTDLST